jgi:DMSO/TMAO reductase YedYZ heme-binding membrane subunit
MSDTTPSVTPVRLLVFAIALVAVPIFALSVLVYDVATDTEDALLQAIIPAIVGAALGILMTIIGSIRSAKIREGSRWERVALIAVPLAAVLGGVSNDFPRWVNAGVEGWATGFFLALNVLLLRLWHTEPEFRERIKAVRSSQS